MSSANTMTTCPAAVPTVSIATLETALRSHCHQSYISAPTAILLFIIVLIAAAVVLAWLFHVCRQCCM